MPIASALGPVNFSLPVDMAPIAPQPNLPEPMQSQFLSLACITTDAAGNVFNSQSGGNPATLVFEEKINQISTIGASFDTAIDSTSVPIVLRGELSYDIGVKQAIIDLNELSIGNLVEALTVEDADVFKYPGYCMNSRDYRAGY